MPVVVHQYLWCEVFASKVKIGGPNINNLNFSLKIKISATVQPNWLRSGPAISLATKVRRGLGGVYNYLLYTGHQLLWHILDRPKEVITVGLDEVTGDKRNAMQIWIFF